jgi:hypothetical protein
MKPIKFKFKIRIIKIGKEYLAEITGYTKRTAYIFCTPPQSTKRQAKKTAKAYLKATA